jgi:putative spermidine/putrescine transport system permease protein
MTERAGFPSPSGAASFRDVWAMLGWRLVDALVWTWRTLRLNRTGRFGAYLLILPAALTVGLLAVSLGYLTWTSLHTFDPYLYIQGDVSGENYRKAIEDPFYRSIFLRTLTVAAVVTVISLALALPYAYAMVRTSSRLIRFALLFVIFLPFLVGDVVRSYSWLVMIGGNGAVPWAIDLLGFQRPSLIGTQVGVALGLVQLMLPLMALTLLPSLHGIDPQFEEAAATLGARRWRTWTHVVLPMARPGLIAAVVLGFTLSLTAYATPALLGNGLQDFIANTIQIVSFDEGNPYLGSALGVIVLVIATTLAAFALWLGSGRGAGRAPQVAEGESGVRALKADQA